MGYSKRSAKTQETTLTRTYIVQQLRKKLPGIWVEKIPGSPFNKGMPDVVFVMDGIGGIIENKKKGNKPSALQELRLRQVASAGGIALCTTFLRNGQISALDYTLLPNNIVAYIAKEVLEALGVGSVQSVKPK